jgi:hypothetical protein
VWNKQVEKLYVGSLEQTLKSRIEWLPRSTSNNSRSDPTGGSNCPAAMSLRSRRSPAPTQRPVNIDQRRCRVGLRLCQLVALAQHFAFGVEHDQKIRHARVETQARQLRRFLCAGSGAQQAFGVARLRPAPDERPRGGWLCCIRYAIDSCLRPSLMGWRPILCMKMR